MATKKSRAVPAPGKKYSAKPPEKLLSAVSDMALPDRSRLDALYELGAQSAFTRDTFDTVAAVLRDSGESLEVRNQALSTLQAASFDPSSFAPFKRAYVEVLREMCTDPELDLRQRAFGILSREGDLETQAMLLTGLEFPGDALLPPEKALQLLSNDQHGGAYAVARKIAQDPPNDLARREALRVLAADAQSTELFERVLLDKSEPEQVRQLAASSLNQLAPQKLQACARQIAVDASESDDMKSLGLTALTHFGDALQLASDQGLHDMVDAAQAKALDGGGTLAGAAMKFKKRYGG